MTNLVWQNINNNDFNVFIRDLGENLNTNVKHIIEDSIKDDNIFCIIPDDNDNLWMGTNNGPCRFCCYHNIKRFCRINFL